MTAGKQQRTLVLDLLRGLGACPAVSFLEGPVAAYIQESLRGMDLTAESDQYGNFIVHHSRRPDKQGNHPPIAFVAHMDHPGFEALETAGDTVIARALGGVPQACFTQKIPVQIVLPDGRRLGAETDGAYGAEDQKLVSIRLRASTLRDQARREARSLRFPAAVVLDLPDFQFDGDLIHMRALDDLAGCAATLAALKELACDETVGEVYGVFTRAEEVGLIGARLLAEEGVLPADALVVSLEASRALTGAAVGEGPVIRVGDASFTFDAEAEGVLVKAREELMEGNPNFKAQRQLMSGGTCEASAFRYYGYRTTGIALPLGNYHNATPDGGVAAEYIHINDFMGGVELMVQAARSVARRRESRPWLRMGGIPSHYRARLIQTGPTL